MIHIYPTYYKKFKCIANRCIDSCCKGWDVVVDDETDAYYGTVQGEFGDKVRKLTTTDSDGDRIFISQNGRCPFWNKDMLCDIFINLGEEHLCRTCRNFPRITQDYTVFSEHLLSFACPEAARLILEEDDAYKDFVVPESDFSDCGYDANLMKLLLEARKTSAEIFADESYSFAENLSECLEYNQRIQNVFDGENAETFSVEHKDDVQAVFDMHKKLDIMTDEWRNLLDKTDVSKGISPDYDAEFKRLALYYIYRYYLTAIDTMNVASTIKRVAYAYAVIGNLLQVTDYSAERLFTLYSKEVEHSPSNLLALGR